MNNINTKCKLICLLAIIISHSFSDVSVNLYGQTYYYKRIKIVNGTKITNVNDDSHYITFTPTVCYDSDANGYGLSNISMKYMKTENSIDVYYGDNYYGPDTYCYSSINKDRINIKNNGIVYVYERVSSSTCNAKKRIKNNNFVQGNNTSTSRTGPIHSQINSTSKMTKPNKRRCPGCGGDGYLPDRITYTGSYIADNQEWCDKCKKWSPPHVHHRPICTVCGGKNI